MNSSLPLKWELERPLEPHRKHDRGNMEALGLVSGFHSFTTHSD